MTRVFLISSMCQVKTLEATNRRLKSDVEAAAGEKVHADLCLSACPGAFRFPLAPYPSRSRRQALGGVAHFPILPYA